MKIGINGLFISSQNTGGGRYLLELLEGLQSIGLNEKYSVFVRHSISKLSKITHPCIEIFPCGWVTDFRPSRILWEQYCLPRVVIEKGIDIFHAAGFTLPHKLTTRSVITIFDMTFFSMPDVHLKSKVAYFKAMIPAAVKKADAVIAISSQTKYDIINYLGTPEKKIKVIHIGIGDEFKVITDETLIKSVRALYSLPAEYILFVGTIEPRKNIDSLIRAYAQLKKRGCRHKLVIAGRHGWGYNKIYSLISSLELTGDVVFTGYVLQKNLPALYSGASVFVYPSLYEGFGIPVLEAMKCGTPVITSNTSSMPEVSADAAMLIDPYDKKSLVSGIEKVINEPDFAASLRSKGSIRASLFSRDKMARETLSVYRAIA